ITGIAVLSLLLGGLAPPSARAASPQSINPAGAPIKWDNSIPIAYAVVLKGDAGRMKHADVAALVDKAFQAWSSVDTAKIAFNKQPEIATDVTAANLGSFLANLDPAVTPVIIDLDGSITVGNSPDLETGLRTVAFGGALDITPDAKFVDQGFVVINARAMDGM